MATIDLRKLVTTLIQRNAEYSGLRSTMEKELLHYEILAALSKESLLKDLTFQGGTCLRLAHGSNRLSEDLDFVGGVDFDYGKLVSIKQCVEDYIGGRHGIRVTVAEPNAKKLLNEGIKVGRWKVSIETEPEQKSAPWHKIKLEVANVPAYTGVVLPVKLNYDVVPGGFENVLVRCESKEEILADKYVAIACRNFVKARDLWDVAYLRQASVKINADWINRKFEDYQNTGEPVARLADRIQEAEEFINGGGFDEEMRRFLLPKIVATTLDQEGFHEYVSGSLKEGFEDYKASLNVSHGPKFTM